MAVSFSTPDKFNRNKAYTRVVFGYDAPLMEVELNEMQKIFADKFNTLAKSIASDGFVNLPNLSLTAGTFTLPIDSFVVGGTVFEMIEPMTLAVTSGDTVYLAVWEQTVAFGDTLKTGGNLSGGTNIADNGIYDQRAAEETTRRVQLQMQLVKSNADANKSYLPIASITGAATFNDIRPRTRLNLGLPDNFIVTSNLKDSSVTDAKLGDRTVNDSTAPLVNTASLTNLLSGLAYMVKAITGKANWRTAPRTTLENAVKLDGDTMTGALTVNSRLHAKNAASKDLSVGDWGDLSANSSGHFLIANNAYTIDGATIKYSTTHPTMGARGIRLSTSGLQAFDTGSAETTADGTFTPTWHNILHAGNHNNTGDPHPQYLLKSGGILAGKVTYANAEANPFSLFRTTNDTERADITLNDSQFILDYFNDEASSTIRFRLNNTDTETGGGANANSGYVDIIQGAGGTGMTINGSTVHHAGNHNNTGDPHNQYLLKSGGTMSGGLTMNHNIVLNSTSDGASASSRPVYFYATNASSVKTTTNYLQVDPANDLRYVKAGASNVIHHGGNHNSTGDPHTQYALKSLIGAASGIASLGSDGKVPAGQLPSLDYIPTSQKAVANGVASLGADGKVPSGQLPSLNYLPLTGGTVTGAVGLQGVTTLDNSLVMDSMTDGASASSRPIYFNTTNASSAKTTNNYLQVNAANDLVFSKAGTGATVLHSGNHGTTGDPHTQYALKSLIGAASGVASLGADGKVPAAQLPSLNYVPTAGGSMTGSLSINVANGGLEVGSYTANTPFVDFHSSGNNIDYDARIVASGGTTTVGQGTLTLTAANVGLSGKLNFNLNANARLIIPVGTDKYAT